MLYNRRIGMQLLGVIFKNPEILSDTDNYNLTQDDFPEKLPALIFIILYNAYHSGMVKFDMQSFTKEISRYPSEYEFFKSNNGEEVLLEGIELGETSNIKFYYERIKKYSLLRSLRAGGFDISNWYEEDVVNIARREELEMRFENATIQEMLQEVQARFFDIESTYINKKTFQMGSISETIRDTLKKLKEETALGLPFIGEKFSTISMGARKCKVVSLSGDTGTGKSRLAIANACKLAYPIAWNHDKGTWDNIGSNQKIIFVTTELTEDEVQTVVLAYLSGVNERNILSNTLSPREEQRVSQAASIMEYYENNFYVYQLPDPNVHQLTINLRRYIIRHQLDGVFFDYIHTSPNLLSEFSGARVREDVALMLLSTALKNIANEHQVFIWTGTQVNGTIENGKFADVGAIRGQFGPQNILSSNH